MISYKGWTYSYDAQNRLTYASNGSTTAQFYYDGKNRQIARNINGVIRLSTWDNWELVEDFAGGTQRTEGYLQGATGVIKTLVSNLYYYQDKLGSTTHVANASGALLEQYRYDLHGTPSYFNSTSQPLNSSTYGIVDLYAGERWIPELGLYDLRNRFMSPELGRFLQPDPIGFKGDASNLYRYCSNDPIDKIDPTGLVDTSAPSNIWRHLVNFFNGNPSIEVVLADWTQRIQPAGLTMAQITNTENGQAPSGQMRMVPNLANDEKTAIASDTDHSGGYYEYHLSTPPAPGAPRGRPVSGAGYTVKENLSLVPGIPNNQQVEKKDEKPRALQSNGVYRDYVGLWYRPTSKSNGLTSVVYQTFDVQYKGHHVDVSTRLIHDVRVINGEVVHRVTVDKP